MDFAWLAAFVAVAECGGFSRAAETLHLSQPGVSRQVQRLEREVGAALFERSGGGARLTPAGERLLPHARAALAARDAMAAAVAPSPIAGPLRAAASTTPGEFLVPDLLAGFVAEHPAVRPQVEIVDSAAVEEAVRAGRCDVGFVGAEMQGRGLRYRPIVADEVVLAVPAGHPFAARGVVGLAELAGQPFLDREGGSGTLASVRTALDERGLTLPDHPVVMTLGSGAAIVSAVERGLGIGWVSSLALACRDPRRVVAVRLAEAPVRRVLSLVDDPARTPGPTAAAFVAWVAAWRPPVPDPAPPVAPDSRLVIPSG